MGLATVTGVGSVAGGDVLERGLALGTGFGSVVVGVLERGRAFGTGFGATMAGLSLVFVVGVGATTLVFVVGVGATTSSASSLMAALSEL